ncbi:MAG: hypothetical protein HKP58_10410 [Desulfatitalea sp.]|nr:hypothetical protein [Desulfatitalea sp.]NNK00813.1 hypothetical protein [Desulfatitalea sp.]
MLERPVLAMPQTAQTVAIILFAAIVAVIVGYVIRFSMKNKVSYPIWMIIAIFLATPYETHTALLGHFVYPQEGQISVFSLYGIPMPLYLVLIYVVYVAPFMLFIFNSMEKGTMTPSLWWKMFFISVPCAFMFEPLAIHFGLWNYWGANQPMKILGFPLWWAFVNPTGLMIMTLTVYLIWRDVLHRQKAYTFCLLIPLGLFAFLGCISAPAHITLHSYTSKTATIVGSLLSMAMSVFAIWIGQKILEREARGRTG